MGELIFTVAGTYTIEGRGIVAVASAWGAGTARIGDRVELRRPDGSTLHSIVGGITYPQKELLLSGKLQRADVPVGTEIWTGDDSVM